MNDKEDCAWIFDSLVGFLQGPIWSAPLLTFIEEKSLIFEADTEDSEEYRKIYQEYKNLVDLLLGCFMEDMGITPEQFEHACVVNKNIKLPIHFQQSLFEQIWAANEYEIFKRMMIQKNLELQLQALNMIEQKFGLTPASLVYESDALQDEELVMEELIQKHILDEQSEKEAALPPETLLLDEHERLATEYQNERILLEETIKASTRSSRSATPESESHSSDETAETKKLTKELTKIPDFKAPLSLAPIRSIPIKQEKKEEKKDTKKVAPKQEKEQATAVKEEDIKKRQEYLKARRDKLVALKKEARSQRLEMNSVRPSSARVVAEATMKGNQKLNVSPDDEPSILQVRKALAARLKAEVVHK